MFSFRAVGFLRSAGRLHEDAGTQGARETAWKVGWAVPPTAPPLDGQTGS